MIRKVPAALLRIPSQTACCSLILRYLLDGRILFTPRRERIRTCYEFRASRSLGRLISGVILKKRSIGSPMPASWNQIVHGSANRRASASVNA